MDAFVAWTAQPTRSFHAEGRYSLTFQDGEPMESTSSVDVSGQDFAGVIVTNGFSTSVRKVDGEAWAATGSGAWQRTPGIDGKEDDATAMPWLTLDELQHLIILARDPANPDGFRFASTDAYLYSNPSMRAAGREWTIDASDLIVTPEGTPVSITVHGTMVYQGEPVEATWHTDFSKVGEPVTVEKPAP